MKGESYMYDWQRALIQDPYLGIPSHGKVGRNVVALLVEKYPAFLTANEIHCLLIERGLLAEADQVTPWLSRLWGGGWTDRVPDRMPLLHRASTHLLREWANQ